MSNWKSGLCFGAFDAVSVLGLSLDSNTSTLTETNRSFFRSVSPVLSVNGGGGFKSFGCISLRAWTARILRNVFVCIRVCVCACVCVCV